MNHEPLPDIPPRRLPDSLGVVEWFRPGEHERVALVLEGVRRLGIRRLRTCISWADWHRPDGPGWYDWLIPTLAERVELLPCFTYTPPSLAVEPKCSAPPRDPKAYADFLDLMIARHGRHFEWVQLWNEPNNLNDWDWQRDRDWRCFSEMVGGAAYWAKRLGRRTALAGMCPTDPNWLSLMAERGVLDHIDAVCVHAFPGTWESEWSGWPALVDGVRRTLEVRGLAPEVWITEAGYSTWRHDEAAQMRVFLETLKAPVDRIYWYAFQDLDPRLPSQEGFHFDERHYHLGLVRADGTPKLIYRMLEEGGVPAVRNLLHPEPSRPAIRPAERRTAVVTGGAGFVGANLVDRLASRGERVLIYDNLSRPGVEDNLAWLRERHRARVDAEIADIRDRHAVKEAVRQASRVFHLAAQVAVTQSVADPQTDFEINLRGTLNLLEAMRERSEPPPMVFASTNKVYGSLGNLPLVEHETHHLPADAGTRTHGIDERQPLELYSPYGCSKGGADQYVLDYARIYGLPACVFRMSCLYGPRQFGTEDQGWVAHFLISALRGRPITIFGDGKQVRDVLYVDDVVDAYLLAQAQMGRVSGLAFNIGGGPSNALSLLDLVSIIERLSGRRPRLSYRPWRPGDQLYYVSDTRRFEALTGWHPAVGAAAGIRRLYRWLSENRLDAPRELSA